MTSVDELNKRWEAAITRPIAADMGFAGDALILGARTRLAKVGAPLDEQRLGALLAAAHGRAIAPSSLRHVRRALETWPNPGQPTTMIRLSNSRKLTLIKPAPPS